MSAKGPPRTAADRRDAFTPGLCASEAADAAPTAPYARRRPALAPAADPAPLGDGARSRTRLRRVEKRSALHRNDRPACAALAGASFGQAGRPGKDGVLTKTPPAPPVATRSSAGADRPDRSAAVRGGSFGTIDRRRSGSAPGGAKQAAKQHLTCGVLHSARRLHMCTHAGARADRAARLEKEEQNASPSH